MISLPSQNDYTLSSKLVLTPLILGNRTPAYKSIIANVTIERAWGSQQSFRHPPAHASQPKNKHTKHSQPNKDQDISPTPSKLQKEETDATMVIFWAIISECVMYPL